MTYWITDFLGTISVTESFTEAGVVIVDVRDLRDNEQDVKKVMQKIQIVTGLLALGCRVAIRCVGGLNRSNVIACAVLCYVLAPNIKDMNYKWNVMYGKVRSKVPRSIMNPDFVDTAKKALKKLRNY